MINNNIANEIRKKRHEGIVGYHRFLKLYSKYKDAPICFVEGKDDEAYYNFRVELLCDGILPGFVICEGKDGVLNTYDKLIEHNKINDKYMFFVDRDFDNPVCNNDIYVTPLYSIENFYTTLKAFKKIIKLFFKIDETDPDFDRCIKLYEERKKEFYNCSLLLNAWIACQADLWKQGIESKYNLDKINLKELIIINLNEVKQNYSLESLENLFPEAPKIEREKINRKIHEYKSNPEFLSRGKFEIEFLIEFLELLLSEIREGKNGFSKKKIPVCISKKKFVSEMTPYAETPDCLTKYIKKRWNYSKQFAS
jgi:hypothetical protein